MVEQLRWIGECPVDENHPENGHEALQRLEKMLEEDSEINKRPGPMYTR